MSSQISSSFGLEEWGFFCDSKGLIVAQRVSVVDNIGNKNDDWKGIKDSSDIDELQEIHVENETDNESLSESEKNDDQSKIVKTIPGTILLVSTEDQDDDDMSQPVSISQPGEMFSDDLETSYCRTRTWVEKQEDIGESILSRQNLEYSLSEFEEPLLTNTGFDHIRLSKPENISNLTLGVYPCVKEEWFVTKPLRNVKLVDESTIIKTSVVASDIRKFLRKHSIPLKKFAKQYLKRSQGTLSDLLNHPKDWIELSKKGKEVYVKLMEFLSDDNLKNIVTKLKKNFVRGKQDRLSESILEKLSDGLMPTDIELMVAAIKLSMDFLYIKQHCIEQLNENNTKDESSTQNSRVSESHDHHEIDFDEVMSSEEEPESKKPRLAANSMVSSETQTKLQRETKEFTPKYLDRHLCTYLGCGAVLCDKYSLNIHLNCHSRIRLYQCVICENRFSSKHNLRSHLKTHSTQSISSNICERAKDRLISKRKLDEIEEISFETSNLNQFRQTKFVCGACRKVFKTRTILAKHLILDHDVAEEQLRTGFICFFCSKSFKSTYTLEVHLRVHTNIRPFECEQCQKGFQTKANLQRHIRTHTGEKPYSCQICQARFTEARSVNLHMRKHTGERPYACSICKKRFKRNITLQAHTLVHSKEKAHLCELCGKSFSQKANLQAHVKRHQGAKNHYCELCQLSFLTKLDYSRHNLKHSGERPYQCEFCMKKFTRPIYLQVHQAKLELPTALQCQACNKKFCDEISRKKHVKTHHVTQHNIIKENNLAQLQQVEKFPEMQDQSNSNTLYIAKTMFDSNNEHYLIATVSSVENSMENNHITNISNGNVTMNDHSQSLVLAQADDLSTQLSSSNGLPIILEGVELTDQQFTLSGSRVSVLPQHMLFASDSGILSRESSLPISLTSVDDVNMKNRHNMVEDSDPYMQSVIVESTEENMMTRAGMTENNNVKHHIKVNDDVKECRVVFPHRSDDGIVITMNDEQFCDNLGNASTSDTSMPDDTSQSVMLNHGIDNGDTQTSDEVKGQTYIIVDLEI